MKIKKLKKVLALGLSLTMLAGMAVTVSAEGYTGWKTEDGIEYWYENDVKQGLEGRGKEIFDGTAWYWLDSIDGGKKAVSKDVYQESDAGQWADKEDGTGKWVRYDEKGHMIKGWDVNEDGTWYFDVIFGTMAKGETTIDGVNYTFNSGNGKMESASVGMDNKWVNIDGVDYWYEGGVRQGYDPANPNYRGKEIFDPASNAWYWLDNVDKGKKATSKDVYQESKADDAGNIGKWVRYDENGHMIKGWNEKDGNTYYFDPVYGTMAKGIKTIDNKTYKFDENTGVLIGEVNVRTYYRWRNEKYTYLDADGKQTSATEYKYANDNERTYNAIVYYEGDKIDRTVEYERDANGNVVKQTYKDAEGKVTRVSEDKYDANGNNIYEKSVYYNEDGEIRSGSVNEYTFDENGDIIEQKYSYYTKGEFKPSGKYVYTRENGLLKEEIDYYFSYIDDKAVERPSWKYVYTHENGKTTSQMAYRAVTDEDGITLKEWEEANKTVYSYNEEGYNTEMLTYSKDYNSEEWILNSGSTMEYDKYGNEIKETDFIWNSETEEREETYVYTYAYTYIDDDYYYNGYSYSYKGKYRYGWEYVRDENGRTIKEINYGEDKVIDYYEVYPTITYPASKPENVGMTYDVVYEQYDKDDKLIGKRVTTNKLITYQVER